MTWAWGAVLQFSFLTVHLLLIICLISKQKAQQKREREGTPRGNPFADRSAYDFVFVTAESFLFQHAFAYSVFIRLSTLYLPAAT